MEATSGLTASRSEGADAPESEPDLVSQERNIVRELLQLVADRADAEPNIDSDFEDRNAKIEKTYDDSLQEIITRFASDKEKGKQTYQESRQVIIKRYEKERAATVAEFNAQRDRIISEYNTDSSAAKTEFQESRWTITAVFEGNKSTAQSHLEEENQRFGNALEQITKIDAETWIYLKECKQKFDKPAPADAAAAEPMEDKKPAALLFERIERAQASLSRLRSLPFPKLCKGPRLIVLAAIIWLGPIYPAYLFSGSIGAVAGLVGSAALALGICFWIRALAQSQVRRVCTPLFRDLEEGETLVRRCKDLCAAEYKERLATAKKQFDQELRQAAEKYRRLKATYQQRRTVDFQAVADRYKNRRQAAKEIRDRDGMEAIERYRLERKQIHDKFQTDSKTTEQLRSQQHEESKRTHQSDWEFVTTKWRAGLAEVAAAVEAVNRESAELFPGWSSARWQEPAPASNIPPFIRFGEFQVDLSQVPQGLPEHERLKDAGPTKHTLPALLSFPRNFGLVMEAADQGRVEATELLQLLMYRMLTSMPPGKVRFTIIDPVGLGQNFSSFMHLADFDEALVTSRIWTEAGRIEQRLADLTEHMENVFQKYLRNQFDSIEDYNSHAGEVAEPYRVLVVANFPSNFNTESVRRLVSIAASGPRCGVYTLISVDTKQPKPHGFELRELENAGVHLLLNDGKLKWNDEDFEPYPLTIDGPPAEELSTRLLKMIGAKAKEAKRVEVPFEFVAPTREQWWSADSRRGINVPLGRVGATKRQQLQLGQGTAQHVLIAGKTGSGKSTLLHALINNLVLLYSPDEVELYLVDFKKGVEFKTYANHQLPHARVIAIESEREFGLSVLQRLDVELKQRAERFRVIGAQDVAGYRQANGKERMPRILMIVDEFQEFFVEDDKVAQDASLLLDRLVRQGRAFGMHVLLGSQTLGGAYSLARSTIDQMAVRIALQCSENDAHLILSEDNSAARLLSRPGEAIYNDANGLVEGNNPFQIVWLDDSRRESYLESIHELFIQRGMKPLPQVVFEGNIPADIQKNTALMEWIEAPSWPAAVKVPVAWLGDAVAIKEPTSAAFRARSGNNLLIVGQQEESALAIMATAILSLAAQLPATSAPGRPGARFFVLDGSLEESPQAGYLARLASFLPHDFRSGDWHDGSRIVGEVFDELESRQKERKTDSPSIYLIIFDLPRFRELRKAEDDFSFSSRPDEKPNPAMQFSNILREGPGVDIHTFAWCDSMNNLMRTLDRQSLREFEMRILFQMSANDSSNLIDNPLASKLGVNRAFFHSEEQGRLEKLRPYGRPTESWLNWVKEKFAAKTASP